MRYERTCRNALGTVLVAGLALAGAASAARAQHAYRIQLEVTDLNSGRSLEAVQPKDVLPIEVGQRVRLRMTAIPGNDHRGVRYPATRFVPNPGQDFLRIEENSSARGTLTVTGLRPHGPQGAVPIEYTVLDPLSMDQKLRSAKFYIKVVGAATQTQPSYQSPVPIQGTVTLYADASFRGRSQSFSADDPDLHDNPIGNDTVSSVRVSPGCRATLYRDDGYRGRRTVIEGDLSSLDHTEVGNDSVTSLQLECGTRSAAVPVAPASSQPGGVVQLYSQEGFGGDSLTLSADVADLANFPQIGADRARSARIAPGCRAWLFEDPGYTGRSYYLTRSVDDLAATPVGDDTVSSVRIRCS